MSFNLFSQNDFPEIEKGVLDLSNWNFQKDGNFSLDGEWEFYWNKILTYDEIHKNQQKEYFELPKLWNKYNSENKLLAGYGFATYSLKIILPEKNKIYGFRKGQIFTASKIFINNDLVYKAGEVSETEDKFLARDLPDIFFYYAQTDTITLIVQASNYLHQKGGIKNSIIIGNQDKISQYQERQVGSEYAILGLLFLITISQLALYFFHQKATTYLLFGLACFFSILVLITEGEFIILRIFPGIEQWVTYKIHYSVNYLRVPIFAYFLAVIFKKEISKKVIRILLIIGYIFAIFTLVTPVCVFTQSIVFFLLMTILTLNYLLYGLIKAFFRKKEGAGLSLIGFVFLLLTVVNDILNDRMIVQTFSMASYGAAVFIIFQSTIVSYRFTKLFKKNEKLTKELKSINENLEDLVKQRTSQIEQQKEEIETQAEFLEKANFEITSKNQVLERKNTEITESINYAQKIQNAILPSMKYLEEILPEFFIYFRPLDIVSGDFYWAKKMDNNLYLTVADCTGHGVPGAFMSLLGISFFNEIIENKKFDQPSDFLNLLRKKIKIALRQTGKENEPKDGMDLAFCIVDLEKKILKYSGAYNPVYVFRNDEIIILEADRQPISIHLREKEFTTKSLILEQNDFVYMFTDGYRDQIGGKDNKKFKNSELKKLLHKIHKREVSLQYQMIDKTFLNWKGQNQQVDDILILGFRI